MLCKKILFVLVLLMASIVKADITAGLPEFSLHYAPSRDPFADGQAAIELARTSGRNILIEVGGNWCSWCHVLERFLKSDPVIWNRLHTDFVVLKVNVGDGNENTEFMAGLPPARGYPHMYVARGNGSVIYSQDTAEFLHKGKYSAEKFLQFLDRWSPNQIKP